MKIKFLPLTSLALVAVATFFACRVGIQRMKSTDENHLAKPEASVSPPCPPPEESTLPDKADGRYEVETVEEDGSRRSFVPPAICVPAIRQCFEVLRWPAGRPVQIVESDSEIVIVWPVPPELVAARARRAEYTARAVIDKSTGRRVSFIPGS